MVCFALIFAIGTQLVQVPPEVALSLRFINSLLSNDLTPVRSAVASDFDASKSDLTRGDFYVRIGSYSVSGNVARNQISHFSYFPSSASEEPSGGAVELTVSVLKSRMENVLSHANLPGRVIEVRNVRSSDSTGYAEGSLTANATIELAGYPLWGGPYFRFDRAGRLIGFSASYPPNPPAEVSIVTSFEEACNIASAAAMDYMRRTRAMDTPAVTINEEYTKNHPVLWQPSRPQRGNELEPKYRAIRDADSCLAVYAIVFDGVNTRTGKSGPAVRVMVDAKTGAVISCGGP